MSGHLTIVEMAALRSVGSIVIAAGVLFWRGDGVWPALAGASSGDLWRSAIHLLGSLLFIWSVAELPLTFVAAVEFTGPLFAALALLLVTRRVPGPAALAGLGLIGVGAALLIASQGRVSGWEVSAPFGAVMALTVSNLLLATLARNRTVPSIILTMHVLQLPIYAVAIALTTPSWAERGAALVEPDLRAGALIAAAALALAAAGYGTQAALAAASRFSTRLQLCAADVLRIPAVGVAAYLAFGELASPATLLFSALIVVGSLITSWPSESNEASELPVRIDAEPRERR